MTRAGASRWGMHPLPFSSPLSPPNKVGGRRVPGSEIGLRFQSLMFFLHTTNRTRCDPARPKARPSSPGPPKIQSRIGLGGGWRRRHSATRMEQDWGTWAQARVVKVNSDTRPAPPLDSSLRLFAHSPHPRTVCLLRRLQSPPSSRFRLHGASCRRLDASPRPSRSECAPGPRRFKTCVRDPASRHRPASVSWTSPAPWECQSRIPSDRMS